MTETAMTETAPTETATTEEWAALMRAALKGEGTAYRRLLTALAPVLRVAARRILDRAGADAQNVEDVVQETLLAIHLKRQTWDPAQPLMPWVWAIARHKVLDALRRQGRRVHVPIDELDAVLADTAAKADDAHAGNDVARLAESLSGRERAVVEAVYLAGASTTEAGLRLAMSEGAVRRALHRALKRLAAGDGGAQS
ncbi:sigma-70 family RNA polymerase sigma factor [Xanthobacter agilis]|uniref:RNA polymerase sigma-70 factor (ECF subfamily) n=1 Tax=Xanthobacter agilis TaxID=47492 RepID=A0ABU0LG89_XANAG|nr:sigma-70 family RNA polymerase sigma factor [Xanthobacter agilis]MDQ0506129.1 RNA polymerase sigma-70 factor (ECF subfamily) [Xanthobacter agilis]